MKKFIIIIAIVIIFIFTGLFVANKLQKNGDVYKTQALCEKMTGVQCSFGMCENNCGARGRWKGWVPASSGMDQENKSDVVKTIYGEYKNERKTKSWGIVNNVRLVGYECAVSINNTSNEVTKEGRGCEFIDKTIKATGKVYKPECKASEQCWSGLFMDVESIEAVESWEAPIDLIQCLAGDQRSLLHGFGSKTISVKGLDGDKCVIDYFYEVEGAGTESECNIPISNKELIPAALDASSYCKEVKQGKLEDGKIKSCMEKYKKVDFGDCVPGKAADGWSEKVLYPNSVNTIGLKGAPDMFVPEKIKDAGVASYGNSISSCKTDWNIKRDNKYFGVSQEEFCEFIVDYNSSCNNCLLEWQGGCC